MVEGLFTLGSAGLLTALGFLVIYNAAHERLRRRFLAFTLAMSFWQVMFLLSETHNQHALLYNRLTFVGPLLAAFVFFFFVKELGRGLNLKTKRAEYARSISITLLTVGGIALSLSPFVVSGIDPRINSHGDFTGYDVAHGTLYLLYPTIFIVMFLIVLASLIRLRQAEDPSIRRRTNTIVSGITLAAVLGLFTNVLLPIISKTSEYSYLGSLAVVMLVSIMTVAIAKHKLINVQLIVARSFAYLASVTIITVIYAFATVLLVRWLLGDESSIDSGTQLILGLVFILGSLLFRPIKSRFDRLTNRIFYQDAYDPQTFISQLNSALVATNKLDRLLADSSRIINDNLKTEFCLIGVKASENIQQRITGTKHIDFDKHDILTISRFTPHESQQIIVAEELRESHQDIYEILKKYEVAVLVRLLSTTGKVTKGVGYIVLGYKKSGNPFSTQDEKVLKIIANEALIAIRNAMQFEEIERFNETLQVRVDEATHKLKATNDKLKKMDETKDEFISMASHQLRTPLTSIKGYLSMVLDGDVGSISTQQRQLLSQSFNSSQRMANLISDLLNLSRINTGKFSLEWSDVYLPKVVEAELQQLREMAQAKGVEIMVDIPSKFPTVTLDENKMHQVIMNLVDNAIYYTPSGGKVTVKLLETPTAVEFQVIDTGIGVPKDSQHHIFTKMFRAENAQRARPDGTGLGLFLVKKVIVAQGGAVIFESTENKGSTFGFHFSKAKVGRKTAD